MCQYLTPKEWDSTHCTFKNLIKLDIDYFVSYLQELLPHWIIPSEQTILNPQGCAEFGVMKPYLLSNLNNTVVPVGISLKARI